MQRDMNLIKLILIGIEQVETFDQPLEIHYDNYLIF